MVDIADPLTIAVGRHGFALSLSPKDWSVAQAAAGAALSAFADTLEEMEHPTKEMVVEAARFLAEAHFKRVKRE